MEREKFNSTNPVKLAEKINKAYKIINEKIKCEKWRIIKEFKILSEKDFKDLSKNERKKIRNRINRVLYKTSLRNINNLTRGKIIISEKEEKIQKARKDWLEARNLANEYLNNYKKEKENFYKN
jgi:hypothetical protein